MMKEQKGEAKKKKRKLGKKRVVRCFDFALFFCLPALLYLVLLLLDLVGAGG